jgi:hypothetical protein
MINQPVAGFHDEGDMAGLFICWRCRDGGVRRNDVRDGLVQRTEYGAVISGRIAEIGIIIKLDFS